MYADRSHVRDIPIKVRLNHPDTAALKQRAQREQKLPAALAYELLVKAIREEEQRNQSAAN